MDNKKPILLTVIICLAIAGLGYYNHIKRKEIEESYAAQEAAAEEELERQTVYTEGEIIRKLEEAVIKNEADNIFMRVPATFDQDELMKIAEKMDPMLGTVHSLIYSRSKIKEGDGPEVDSSFAGVNFTFEKFDEYYVYEALVEKKEIPSDRENAIRMKDVCEDFIKNNITDNMDEYEKELAIHDYIINTCDYAFSDDNDKSEFKAYGALVNHKAVCEGYARATQLLLKCCGIEATLVSGHSKNHSGGDSLVQTPDGVAVSGHMWNQVRIDGLWYNLDTTWDDPISDTPELYHIYMNLDDSHFYYDHIAESDNLQQCASMMANYYEKNGQYMKNDNDFKNYIKTTLDSGSRDTIECVVSYPRLDEDSMYFILQYPDINSYQIGTSGIDSFQKVSIYINP